VFLIFNFFNFNQMKKIFSLLVVLIALLSMSNVALKAQLYNNYSKIPGKGTPLDVSGGTEIFPSGTGYYDRQGTWPTVPIQELVLLKVVTWSY
jgi:hypothetical protein